MDLRKDSDRKGFIGTIAVHALLILLFIISAFSPEVKLEEEDGGVEVSLGEPDYGGPDDRPAETIESSQPESTPESSDEPVLSQDEEAPEVQQTTKPKPNTKPSETKPLEESKPEERKPDQRAMFPGSKSSKGQGSGEKTGNQGQPDGSVNGKPDGTGTGKSGDGSYSLSGRSPVQTSRPKPSRSISGTVVVYITVNSRGVVTKAQAGARGTTISDKYFWKISEDAAKNWKFDPRKGGSDDQFGTITFEYSQK